MKVDEGLFEEAVGSWLAEHGGYSGFKHGTRQGTPRDLDATVALDTAELFAFIGATQADEWERLKKNLGGTDEGAQTKFTKRLAAEIDRRGVVDVLRRGVVEHGVTIKLAFFKPAHGLTRVLAERYEANRLTVTQQLPFGDGTKTPDLCLFVNGLPVATAELKTHLTGQSVEDAKEQYRRDRDPTNALLRRAVVHFAVDTEMVAMTTRLAGKSTQFLPFNLGREMGPGNPPGEEGKHRTAYLWERVWQRDAWLDLLGRFVITKPGARKQDPPTTVFPRFHQWDAVRSLEAAARTDGAGGSYLVQHSAGSGKSNTIAWLAHRLSVLHDDADVKVFDKVVVITDRVVLDRQLQETIYGVEHAHGVVQKIDDNSAQLAEALAGEQAQIVITTLQKFPFVIDKIDSLPDRRYAVIVDEAHSSQSGEAAKDLRLVLGGTEETELTVAEAEDADFVAVPENPAEEALAKAAAARTRQGNLSFFAFTATPKAKTLELFGRVNADGKHEPFHLYSMRQAIEEGFILDVLANYVTYKTYWRIQKAVAEDPEYDEVKAKRAIARFVDLHPHNLAQKAEIVVEHFRRHTALEIAGRAKAMVVTSSRLHAVRYKEAIDRYIVEKGYADLAVLVAFSGKVIDAGDEFTEARMNGFPDSRTAAEFDTDEYQVMVVAEKYQTGFDQPLLHTMFVDKTLTGLAAVQTLSRLNRIHPDKRDTFVLDFRNDADDIAKAFQPWYTATVAPPTDPNLLYDTRAALDPFDVLRSDEIEKVVAILLTVTEKEDSGRVYSALAPAIDRFNALDEEDRDEFRDVLNRFLRTYAFLSQVVTFTDTNLERDYRYCRALSAFVKDSGGTGIDLGSEVELTHLRHEITSEGSISLDPETGEVVTIFDGRGRQHDAEEVPLSTLVEMLNERFGTDWTDADQLLFDQFEADWVSDLDLGDQARSNDLDNFMLVFARLFMKTVVTRMDANEGIFKKLLDDESLRAAVQDHYGRTVYEKLRDEGAPD